MGVANTSSSWRFLLSRPAVDPSPGKDSLRLLFRLDVGDTRIKGVKISGAPRFTVSLELLSAVGEL